MPIAKKLHLHSYLYQSYASSLTLIVCIRTAIFMASLRFHANAFSISQTRYAADGTRIYFNSFETRALKKGDSTLLAVLGISANDANDGSNNKTTTGDKFVSESVVPDLSSKSQPQDQSPKQLQKPYLQMEKEVIGIGGKTGRNDSNYDLNKLKNNLVQKSIRQFKKELLLLLIETDNSKNLKHSIKIEEKLAALVSANPVATTTDSNLLEGTWELAFATSNAAEILDEARFIYSRKKDDTLPQKRERGNWKLSTNKMDNPLHTFKRSIFLEELEDDENPFMVDSIELFRGLWTVQRFYDIVGVSSCIFHVL